MQRRWGSAFGGGPDGSGVGTSAVDGDGDDDGDAPAVAVAVALGWVVDEHPATMPATTIAAIQRLIRPLSSRLAEDASGRACRRQAVLRSSRWSRSLAASSIALWRHSAARNWQAMRPIRWTRRKSP